MIRNVCQTAVTKVNTVIIIVFQLSRSWLGERAVDKQVPMHTYSLLITLQFVPSEVTLRRVPTARTAGLFGAKIQQVCK